MRSRSFGAAIFLFAAAAVTAQENSADIITAFRDRAVVIQLTARVVERDVAETWNSATSKVTIPGRPVTLKLVGANVVVAAQFTPYTNEDGKKILVAQGQVWVTTKDEGMLYYTSMQTIPIEFGERVYFFPLGQKKDDGGARIEVQLILTPYVEGEAVKKTPPAAKPEQPKEEKPAAAPKAEQAKTEQPKQDKPAAAPKTEQPKVEQTKTEPPKTEPPKSVQPKVEQPKQEKTVPAPKPDGEKRAAE